MSGRGIKLIVIAVIAMLLATSACISVSADGQIPASYNLDTDPDKRYGDIFPVRSQGSLSTCWAFAASAAVESSMRVADPSYTTRISPLAMAYSQWDTNKDDQSYRYQDVLCNTYTKGLLNTGSRNTFTLFGLTSGKIMVLPEYCATYDLAVNKYDYSISKADAAENYIVVKGIECYDLRHDADIIKQRLMEGYVGSFGYNADNNTVLDGTTVDFTYYYDGMETNHAVALVGWDDGYSKDNFKKTPSSDGAWRVRNTYKNDGTLDGYTWVSYESVTGSVYFITDADYRVSGGRTTNVYAYDMGYSVNGNITTTGTAYMANIFTANGDESLDGISFSAFSEEYNTIDACNTVGERYSISVYRLNDNYVSPTDGVLIASDSGTVGYRGIVYEDFEQSVPLKKGDVFSVVIEVYNPTGVALIPIDTEYREGNFYFYTAANPGESFINTDGTWTDISADRMSNVRIKAYTSSACTGKVTSSDGEKSYNTISEAISDGTYDIVLTSDIELDSSVVYSGDLTVDLNGHRIVSTASGYAFDVGSSNLALINGYLSSSDDGIRAGSVTLMNSEIDCSDIAVTAGTADITVSLISKGKIEVTGTADAVSEVFCSSKDKISFTGTGVHITDGKYQDVSVSGGTADIVNGEFNKVTFSNSTVTVSEGEFSELYSTGGNLTLMRGYYHHTVLSGGTVNIKAGEYFNDISWAPDTTLTIYRGNHLSADTASVIESKMDQPSKDRGFRAVGSKETGWSIERPEAYRGSEPCSIESALSGPDGTIKLADDVTLNTVSIVSDIILDLNGCEITFSVTTIRDGAHLTIKNGRAIIGSDRFIIESGGILTVGSDGTDTSVDCGRNMIIADEDSTVTVSGSGSQIKWGYRTDSTLYSFGTPSFSYSEGKMIVTSEGTAKNIATAATEQCTAVRTIWEKDGRSYDYITVSGTQYLLDVQVIKSDTFNYSCVAQNGRCTLKCNESTDGYKYQFSGGLYEGTVSIDMMFYGLRYSSAVSDDAIDTLCGYADKVISGSPGCGKEIGFTCVISDYEWHDTSLPYKVFSQHAIEQLRSYGCKMTVNMAKGMVDIPLSAVTENESFTCKFEAVQNTHLTSEQSRIIRENHAYYLCCSSASALEKGVKVSLKDNIADKNGLKLYLVADDGSFSEVQFESSDSKISFLAHSSGIYALSKSKVITVEEQPTAVSGLVSNGSMQRLIEPASGIKGGYAEYSLDNQNWSSEIPCAKNAGTYTVYYRYTASELGYSDSAGGSIVATIGDAPDDGTGAVSLAVAISASVFVILTILYLAIRYRRY